MTTRTTRDHPAERSLRADARRNRAKVLAAADEVFASHGTDAALDDIAKRAGVGNATLYRHFPTRQDLLVALLRERVDLLAAQANDLLADPSPREALQTWLLAVARHATTYRGLAGELMTTDEPDLLFEVHRAMRSAGAALVERAQEAKVLRADLKVAEVLQLVNAVALATEQAGHGGARRTARLLDLLLDGLLRR